MTPEVRPVEKVHSRSQMDKKPPKIVLDSSNEAFSMRQPEILESPQFAPIGGASIRWTWDSEKLVKPDLAYFNPSLKVWRVDDVTGALEVREENQEIIGITTKPLIRDGEDSFSIEITHSSTMSINIGLANMVFDSREREDWVMMKGWFLSLRTLK